MTENAKYSWRQLRRVTFSSKLNDVEENVNRTIKIRQGLDFIIVPPMLARQIWIPDLFIEGSKKSFAHITTVENTVMRISGKGVVDYTTKITSTMICEMALRYF